MSTLSIAAFCFSQLAVFGRRSDYSEAALQDAVTNLPGLPSDVASDYTMFSGYITVNETHGRKLFYWFVESLNDAKNDPVALWTNGMSTFCCCGVLSE